MKLARFAGVSCAWLAFQSLWVSWARADFHEVCAHPGGAASANTVAAVIATLGATDCESAHQALTRAAALDLSRARLYALLGGDTTDPNSGDTIPGKSRLTDLSPLSSLAGYPGLRALNLNDQLYATDVAPLGALTQLESLNLDSMDLRDGSPLASLTRLTELRAVGSQFRDYEFLRSMPHLKILSIEGTPFQPSGTYEPLRGLAELEELEFFPLRGGFGATQDRVPMDALAGMSRLSSLKFANGFKHIQGDLRPLAGLAQLRTLWIADGSSVVTLAGLEPLTQLEELVVANRDPRAPPLDIGALAGHAALRKVTLSMSDVRSLAPLRSATQLETLDVQFSSHLESLDGLQAATGLRELHAYGIGATDLSPLSGLARLEVLELSGVGGLEGTHPAITDLSPLAGLHALRVLDLGNSVRAADLRPLSGLSQLEQLSLRAARGITVPNPNPLGPLTDLRPLATLARLKSLDLSDNSIVDLRPLTALPSLSALRIEGNPMRSISALAGVRSLQSLELGYSHDGGYLGNLHVSNGQATRLTAQDRAQKSELVALSRRCVMIHFEIVSPYPDLQTGEMPRPEPWDSVLGVQTDSGSCH